MRPYVGQLFISFFEALNISIAILPLLDFVVSLGSTRNKYDKKYPQI